MSKAYTLPAFRIYEEGARGRWHWEVSDAGDDVGVVIEYHEEGRESSEHDSHHIGIGPAGLRAIAAAIIAIAEHQEKTEKG